MKVMILAFLCLTVTLIIAGCAGAADEVLSASTLTSTSAPTSSPSAAPLISTATPSASLTPTLAPTDTPTAEPTATPTPQIGDARTINEDLQVFVGQDWVNLPEEAIDNEYVFRLVDDGMFLVDNEDYPKYTLRTDQENGGLTWEEVLQFVHGYAVKDGEAYQEVNGELQKVTFSPEIQEALRSGEIEISGMVEVQQE